MKTTRKYHYIPIRMATIKNTDKEAEQMELSYFTRWKANWYGHSEKHFGSFL